MVAFRTSNARAAYRAVTASVLRRSPAGVAATPVLILGGGETALGLLRAFAARRIPTLIYTPPCDLTRRSRWCRPLDAPPGLPLPELLEHVSLDRAVLCPTSDHTAQEVAALPAELQARFFACVPDSDVLRAFVDKALFANLLATERVPAPFSRAIDSEADIEAIPDAVLPRLILKPRDSITFHARFGVKAVWATSRHEALRKFREFDRLRIGIVAQEYIPGEANACYLLDGFIDRHGGPRALLARRKLRIYPADFGNPCFQVSVPLQEVRPACDNLLALLARARYRGVFSALVKHDRRDGLFKMIEVNARPYWFIDFTRWCGVDLPWMLYLDALGREVPEQMSYAAGKYCMYPYYDIHRASWGGFGLARWMWQLLGAWQPVFHWNDPAPALPPSSLWGRRAGGEGA